MRWLCLWLPQLALEILPFPVPSTQPTVISHTVQQRTLIWLANPAAQHLGIKRGMSLAMAQALVPGLTIFTRTDSAEALARAQVATIALQFSSDVQLTQGGAILLEIERSALLFRKPQQLLQQLQHAIAALGYSVQAQFGWGATAALVLSRLPTLTQTGPIALQQALRQAPLRCLSRDGRVPRKWLEHFQQIGVQRIGDLLDLPRPALGRRFGQELLDYLARLQAQQPDTFAPFQLPETFQQSIELPRETDQVDALLFPIRRLFLALESYLRTRQLAVNRLQILLGQHRRKPQAINVGTVAPSWLASEWLSLCRLRLERQPLLAPVLEISVKAEQFVPLTPTRAQLFASQEDERNHEQQLLSILRARLGDSAVQQFAVAASWWPEHAMTIRAVAATTADDAISADEIPAVAAERPLVLLAHPQPLKSLRDVPQYRGPLCFEPEAEWLQSEWWQQQWAQREYRIARNPAGERLWLFRDSQTPGQWYLHGVFGC
ncbi:DNA polymerase Y family protein [Permianibacter sp. IMCC34836]|uniref:Y-family DNA polymerase n=1 Tax=Permianibacter fluminis TaxID=2738515 RepID=UPI001551DDA7|nr:DNA polymerase Y family protein [Permianibacter fluminis]NQD37702.1 DNA polymerase Y family protein [Permianibacter fluminis]